MWEKGVKGMTERKGGGMVRRGGKGEEVKK
jgi:hypothetical protein